MLKSLGFPEKYFSYNVKDAEGKARARAECESFADEWTGRSGIDLSVDEGCFL